MNFNLDNNNQALVRCGNGVKAIELMKENKNNSHLHKYSYHVNDLLQMPFNVYFLDNHSLIQSTNEISASTCGFTSVRDAIGRTVKEIFHKQSAINTLKNDEYVIKKRAALIAEETFKRLDNISYTGFDFKFPLYGNNNEVIGIFGFAFILGLHSLQETLSTIFKIGLLSPLHYSSSISILPGTYCDNVYLTKRETEITNFIVLGKTSKFIATQMNVSPRTIEKHMENIKIKMKANNKSELIEKLIHIKFNIND